MSDAGTQQDKATLTIGDRTAEFPVLRGTDGVPSVDISTFTRQTGHTTLDYGFVNTAATKSAITFIDGDQGILRYRGYPIEQLAQNSTYLEVAWLLHLRRAADAPTSSPSSTSASATTRCCTKTSSASSRRCRTPRTRCRCCRRRSSALSTYYEHESDPNNPEHVELNTIRMLAKLPVIAAYAHKKSIGQAFLYPDNSLSFVDNFLKLNFGVLSELYEINPVMSRALERLLILHEDHEQNASTSTVRLVGSTGANQFSSISAGINALYGPLHGGANEAVLEMLARIRDSGESVQRFVERVKNKEDGVKLMGFGHRVYKNYDPRAKLVKESADEVLDGARRAATRCSTSRRSSRRSRSTTTTSRSAGSTRTSTSTPASSTRRWASRRGCSRCCSRSAGCRAGSRTGARCRATRRPRSAARSSCTSAPRAARLPGRRLTPRVHGWPRPSASSSDGDIRHVVLDVARRALVAAGARAAAGSRPLRARPSRYGTRESRCAIMLIRLARLSSDAHLAPRRLGDVGVDEHRVLRAGVVLPLGDRHHVVRAQLPPAHRILGARAEPLLLLDVRHAEPVLEQDDAVLDQHPLEDRRLVQEPVVLARWCSSP